MSDFTSPSPRRAFFHQALARVLRPLADFLEKRLPPDAPRPFLRPPGAIAEPDFLSTCLRCGNCVNVCPAHCIVPLPDDAPAAGTPAIYPDVSPCVVCDGIQCTHVCPSGALRPLARALDIRIGHAEVYDSLCVRTSGESCTLCVDRCPIGPQALRFDDAGPPAVLDACVGCGVCQFHCPTEPKAIVVRPC